MQELIIQYFENLFEASDTYWEDVVQCISTPITEEHDAKLLRPIENQEVKNALFHMHPDNSLGSDGMSPDFYQKYWNIVEKDVIELVTFF